MLPGSASESDRRRDDLCVINVSSSRRANLPATRSRPKLSRLSDRHTHFGCKRNNSARAAEVELYRPSIDASS
jgi:hypothetical protein